MTPKQKKFVREYLIDLNGTQAAIRAGYSKNSAKEISSQLLTKVNIQEEITKRREEISKKNDIEISDIIQELKKIGMSDIGNYIDESGDFRNVHEIKEEARRAIGSVEVDENILSENQGTNRKTKFKLHDKLKALDMLMKYLGGYEKDNGQKEQPTIKLEIPAKYHDAIERLGNKK